MSIYPEKYGFVYIWYDRKQKRYYIGCHWGHVDDGYICSSSWMKRAYKNRPTDFRRRILSTDIQSKEEMYLTEQRWLSKIRFEEVSPNTNKPRYYNINIIGFVPWHATDDGVKTVGEKISKANKGKKFGPRDPLVGQRISETKKAKFEERQQKLGYKFSDQHREKLAAGRKDKPHTEEWKLENGKRMKEQWSNGARKRAEPKLKMTKEEQAQLSANRLKDKWSDPVWKAKQQERLKESSRRRWNK